MRPWGVLLTLIAASLVGGWMKAPSEPSSSSFLVSSVQGKVICPKCKKKNLATNNSCEFCGAKLNRTMAIKIESKVNSKGIEMMRVPAGEFTMGSNNRDDEMPIRTVYLDEYWIGKTEVTVAQFRRYCDSADYKYDWNSNKPSWGWIDDHPMVNVNWSEARAFCQWAGGDLPTEAQWEKAARGKVGLKFPWGNDFDPLKLWCSKKEPGDAKSTAPIGSFPSGASPYGCLDMAGNVWEWCRNWYSDNNSAGQTRNPTGPGFGQERSLRGGSWFHYDSTDIQGSNRNGRDPTIRIYDFGFRLAGLVK